MHTVVIEWGVSRVPDPCFECGPPTPAPLLTRYMESRTDMWPMMSRDLGMGPPALAVHFNHWMHRCCTTQFITLNRLYRNVIADKQSVCGTRESGSVSQLTSCRVYCTVHWTRSAWRRRVGVGARTEHVYTSMRSDRSLERGALINQTTRSAGAQQTTRWPPRR